MSKAKPARMPNVKHGPASTRPRTERGRFRPKHEAALERIEAMLETASTYAVLASDHAREARDAPRGARSWLIVLATILILAGQAAWALHWPQFVYHLTFGH